MVRRVSGGLLMAGALSFAVFAQTPAAPPPAGQAAAPAAPQAGRGGGRGMLVSPQVSPDKTITLRFRAPNAKDVTVIGELDGKTHPMTKGDDGVWTATIGPFPHDVYN
jgi:hypothetical protein